MSQTGLAHEAPAPLLELLREQFSKSAMQGIVGEGQPHLEFAVWDATLHGPLREFLNRPGKQFRGRLLEASYQIAGGKGTAPERLALLVEILHAGSLIVDDIEDNSAERRGAPALHRLIGVPRALNVGNWLYFWALSLVEHSGLGPHAELAMHRWLSQTLLKCHYGQALDLDVQVATLPQSNVHDLVATSTRLKTGCLMGLALAFGALAAGANRETVQALADFGGALGVGLQMLDDLGGLGSEARKHKGYEDLQHGRLTWPWAWLSRRLSALQFVELQREALAVECGEASPEALSRRLLELLGDEGHSAVKRQLRDAFEELKGRIGPSHAVTALSAEIHRLEQSYV